MIWTEPKDVDELSSTQTVGVYFAENGEIQLLDENNKTQRSSESDEVTNVRS